MVEPSCAHQYMNANFYRSFEDKMRGPRELILSRLQAYHPFVQPLISENQPVRAIDLGCGRGEWLELLNSWGLSGYGFDSDEGMLQACAQRELAAKQMDVIEALMEQSDSSVAMISAFHLVEHLPFPRLQTLVKEALRVLQPGGLLIMETPNPENIVVGSNQFYLDPTHQRPLPSQLLAFLTEHEGFARTKVLYLQESSALSEAKSPSLYDVLAGVSPDYAVIAQKNAAPDHLKLFDEAFSKEHGLSLRTLSQLYDQRLIESSHQLEDLEISHQATAASMAADLDRIDKMLHRYVHQNLHHVALDVQGLHRAHQAPASGFTQVVEQSNLIQERLRGVELRAQQAEQALATTAATLNSIRTSTLWRLTSPVRWGLIQIKLLVAHGPVQRLHSLWRKLSPSSQPEPTDAPSNPAAPADPIGQIADVSGPATHEIVSSLSEKPLPTEASHAISVASLNGHAQAIYEQLKAAQQSAKVDR